MNSTRSKLTDAVKPMSMILAASIAVLGLSLTLLQAAQDHPGATEEDATKWPGYKGEIEYKPADLVITYWKDTDGVDPAKAGCHVGYDQAGKQNGRFFAEACLPNGLLVESNPAAGVLHGHKGDIGHPYTFDCNAWCVGVKMTRGGSCKAGVPAPDPCKTSAICECR